MDCHSIPPSSVVVLVLRYAIEAISSFFYTCIYKHHHNLQFWTTLSIVCMLLQFYLSCWIGYWTVGCFWIYPPVFIYIVFDSLSVWDEMTQILFDVKLSFLLSSYAHVLAQIQYYILLPHFVGPEEMCSKLWESSHSVCCRELEKTFDTRS